MNDKILTRRNERQDTIKKIGSNPVVTGPIEMYKMRALNSLIEDLEDSINRNSKSNNCLSIVLVIATCLIALVEILTFVFKMCGN